MSDYDPDALRPLILANNGDVTAIAEAMRADSEDLRNYIMNTPVLRRALDEVIHRGVDKSLGVLFKLLDSEHENSQLAASKEFLKSRAAQRRGFHHAGDLELKMPSRGGALTLTWLPPEDSRALSKDEPPLIEGTVNDG